MNTIADQIPNYYELLEIGQTASKVEIKQAYLRKVKEWHPDKNLDRTQEAEEKTKILNEAYHILSDPERRKTYDRMLQYTKGKKFGEYINDDAIRNKINKAYPALKKALGNVSELYSIFKDTVNGHYSLDPTHLAMIGGGLLYFILPADFIPDFIPFIGYIDDLAVLTTIMNSLKEEISEYRNWKEKSK
jgi:curved DNA-binding protein CbpA